mmetsp:Transcript_796/g.662  ORF Transcript_796/g.662 Transcript_796/m.662 type:complete len:645 (+) Transcript_796:7-1941(+)
MNIFVITFIFILLQSGRSWGVENGYTTVIDESSFSNIDEVETTHFELEIDLDFKQNLIHGHQTLYMKTKKFGISKIRLDISGLEILNVSNENGRRLDFKINSSVKQELGQELVIGIPTSVFPRSNVVLIIDYITSKNPSAVSWLTKEQTTGKILPFMYTQCEPIHCRSLAPLQDTPAIKSTFSLLTKSPRDIIVRASGNVTEEYINGRKRYTKFEMNIPVPSYLLAFAAGNLVEKQLSPRTFVISESELIDICVKELALLEEAVKAAESYITPYDWGVYKVLMLPSSFPIGGMENPLLTFANSGLVTGDGSSFRLFVHELSHSWFGNLVTNENWSNFWLNEGFTVFLERKITSILYGKNSSLVDAKLENITLYLDIEETGVNNTFTSLSPLLNGSHPDAIMNIVPYEKGYQFLVYLESVIGESKFQKFLKSYINNFEAKSLGVEDFVRFLSEFIKSNFSRRESKKILNIIDFETWIYQPGYPVDKVNLETDEFDKAQVIAQNYINSKQTKSDKEIYNSFDILLKSIVIMELTSNTDIITPKLVSKIDSELNFSNETNPMFVYLWLSFAISVDYIQSPFTVADEFLGTIGRNFVLTTVYREIIKKDENIARGILKKHQLFYHPIARQAVEDLFSGSQARIYTKYD